MEMKSIISFMFILQAIINGVNVNLTIAQSFRKDRHACKGDDFESNTIAKNRASAFDKLLALLQNSSNYGFEHTQAGDKPEEQVSVSFLCSGNTREGLCVCCFKNAVEYLLKNCHNKNEGVAWDFYWYLNCMVRYSAGRKILSILDDWAWHIYPDKTYVKAVELEKTMNSLTSKLKEQAAEGDALQKYAIGAANYDGDEHSLYVVVQCTPDLTEGDCIKCLSKASIEISNCCIRKHIFEGRVLSSNCFIRYAHLNYLNTPADYTIEPCGKS